MRENVCVLVGDEYVKCDWEVGFELETRVKLDLEWLLTDSSQRPQPSPTFVAKLHIS